MATKEIVGVEVTLENSLDDCQIDLVQAIEKSIDGVMIDHGFTRIRSSKGDIISFTYKQFGKCHPIP